MREQFGNKSSLALFIPFLGDPPGEMEQMDPPAAPSVDVTDLMHTSGQEISQPNQIVEMAGPSATERNLVAKAGDERAL